MKASTLNKILKYPFWPDTLIPDFVYSRVHDDHDGEFSGILNVQIDRQGDVWISTDQHFFPPMRFRTYGGGGMSQRTRNALLILAEAIRMDNEDHPQFKPNRIE